jgi:hypothetical protein
MPLVSTWEQKKAVLGLSLVALSKTLWWNRWKGKQDLQDLSEKCNDSIPEPAITFSLITLLFYYFFLLTHSLTINHSFHSFSYFQLDVVLCLSFHFSFLLLYGRAMKFSSHLWIDMISSTLFSILFSENWRNCEEDTRDLKLVKFRRTILVHKNSSVIFIYLVGEPSFY